MQGRYTCLNMVGDDAYLIVPAELDLTEIPRPRCYRPKQYFQGYSTRYMIDSMIIRYFDSADKHRLTRQTSNLPPSIIRLLYETKAQFVILNKKFADLGKISLGNRRFAFRLRSIYNESQAGIYFRSENLIILNRLALKNSDWLIPYFLVAQAVENAVLTNPIMEKIRVDQLRPNTYLALPHIIDVSLLHSTTYFYESFHDYFHPERRSVLRERDRLIYRLFENWERDAWN